MTIKVNWMKRQNKNTHGTKIPFLSIKKLPSLISLSLCLFHLWLKAKHDHPCSHRAMSSHILVWERAEVLEFWTGAISPGHLCLGYLPRLCKPLARIPRLFRLSSMLHEQTQCIHHPLSSRIRCLVHLIRKTGHCSDSATECSSGKAFTEKFATKAWWQQCNLLSSGPKAKMICEETAERRSFQCL